MIKATEIAFTVLPVTNISNGRRFYENVLGLKATNVFEKGDMGFVEYDIGAGTLAIGCGAPLFRPSKDGGAVALEVEDFDAAIAALKAAKCDFALEPGATPVCRMATIRDPDGNYIMIHKRKGAHVG
ncbi:glyoxalase [Opitutaceae bacterium EW11]|nr:glyoxalase [Opitutaceae bacterium EW11]